MSKFLIKIILAVVALFVIWIAIAPFLATRLIVERRLDAAEAILVLSGSAVYRERTRKAAELYKKGVAPIIFITNDGERAGWSRSEQRTPSYLELEQRELIGAGVSPDAIIVLRGQVSGTEWEAKALAAEVDQRPLRSVVIVTSPYHTRRSLATFERALSGKGVEIGIEHTPLGEHSPMPAFWWLSRSGWRNVASEYVKSVVYWAYY